MRKQSPGLLAIVVTIGFATALASGATAGTTHRGAAARASKVSRVSKGTATVARAETRAARRAKTARESAPRPASAGLVIGIDRETGQAAMPTPEQMAGLASSQPRSSNRPAPVVHPNGSVSLDTRWLRENFIVRIGRDGRPVPMCVDGDQVQRALKAPAAPARVEEE
jgi:hypothetical protein